MVCAQARPLPADGDLFLWMLPKAQMEQQLTVPGQQPDFLAKEERDFLFSALELAVRIKELVLGFGSTIPKLGTGLESIAISPSALSADRVVAAAGPGRPGFSALGGRAGNPTP